MEIARVFPRSQEKDFAAQEARAILRSIGKAAYVPDVQYTKNTVYSAPTSVLRENQSKTTQIDAIVTL